MRRILLSITTIALALTACTGQSAGAASEASSAAPTTSASAATTPDAPDPHDWMYQLSGYADGKLDAIAATGADVAGVDLADVRELCA